MRLVKGLWLALAGLLVTTTSGIAQQAAPSPASPAETKSNGTDKPAAADKPAADGKQGLIPASAFASASLFSTAQISPDGALVAIRAPYNDSSQILILDAVQRKPVRRFLVNDKDQLEWFRWAGNGKIVFSASTLGSYFGEEMRYTRLFVADIATGNATYVGTRDEGPDGDEVVYFDREGRYLLLAIQQTAYDWPSVWRFPLDPAGGDKPVRVQAAKTGVWDWFADDAGAVRMGFEFAAGKLKVWYRKVPGEDLKMVVKLAKEDVDDKIWDIARIFSGQDEGYVLEKAGETIALRKFNYATRVSGEIVYQNPDWDVTDAFIGEDGKPSVAYFTDDKEHAVWFDPTMKSLQARLEKAMPGKNIWVISRSRGDTHALVFANHEDDPGALYYYDRKARTLDLFGEVRPGFPLSQLVQPKPITYEARDKTKIHGYLTLPRNREPHGLPLIILPHGGPYGIRDSLVYDDEVQFLANRGYAVLQPNYRGSAGYGEAFGDAGKGQVGRKMQDDLDDGMDWLVKQGIADPARVCVVGSSYGGYAALWSVIRNPERYRCAASFAGVTDWRKQLSYDKRFFDRQGGKSWRSRVVGEDAQFDMDTVSPVRQVARLTRPVLLAHGDADTNVPFSQFKLMRDAAQKAGVPIEQLIIPKTGHGFNKPADEQKWYETLEAFLARHNPAN